MKAVLLHNGTRHNLETEREGEARKFTLDGVARVASVTSVEPGIYSVLVDGHSYEVKVIESAEGWLVDVAGTQYSFLVDDPRDSPSGAAGAASRGVQKVAAPMPGKVVRVLVEAGQSVAAGEGIAVVEAMKMQNELKAARDGRVASLHVREGATVAAGEVLATIE
jgi:biotin carboxyl carrier protein